MIRLVLMTTMVAGVFLSAGCERDSGGEGAAKAVKKTETADAHANGADHGHDHPAGADHVDHGHDEEVELGTAMFGNLKVSFAQGHGAVEAGKEGHLVVKLPYNDAGATVVRAWIGGKDRTRSFVGKGTYAPSHDDYDIHAIGPDPLPANVMWWVELQKPDGTKIVGSVKPIL